MNEISLSYERMGTWAHFEKEAIGNWEIAYNDLTVRGMKIINIQKTKTSRGRKKRKNFM